MDSSISQKTSTQVATQYFEAFGKGDLGSIVGLFAQNATVKSSSANYKELEPRTFYEKVLGMTREKSVTIHSVAVDQSDRNIVIVHFDYDWILNDGTRKHFPYAFDKFEIDPVSGKIKSLTINLGTDTLANP